MEEEKYEEKEIEAKGYMIGEILKFVGLAMLFAWLIW